MFLSYNAGIHRKM